MRKILLSFCFFVFALAGMAQANYKQASDQHFNRTMVTLTKAGTLERELTLLNPDDIQGIKVSGPMNEADLRYLYKLCKPGTLDTPHSINLHDAIVDRIPEKCFAGLTYLLYFYLPQTLQEVGDGAFQYTNALTAAVFPTTLKKIGRTAYAGTRLTTVSIPANVEEIGEGAFAHLSKLGSATVDAANTTFKVDNGILINVKENKLLQCFITHTGELNVPTGITALGDYSLAGAKRLTSIHIPASVKTIGEDAFAATYNVESIEVDAGNNYYCSVDGVLFNKNKSLLICYPTSKKGAAYVVPTTVKELATGAFQECGGGNAYQLITDKKEKKKISLKKITLPEGLIKIGSSAFTFTGVTDINIPTTVREIGDGCFYFSDIENITVPEGVTRIENGTFAYCYSLETLSLPSTISYIGSSVFCMNDAMTTLNISAPTPPTCDVNAFDNYSPSSLTLHVVKGAKKAYQKAAVWSSLNPSDIEDDLEIVTHIGTTQHASTATETMRYDLSGRRIATPQRGINLIKMSDGSVRKVVVR
ncbi:leucine-rich repeat domain-containing protein [Hoylesella saccharolytica]|uniref:leucine-rich repeat domain-containing protein n=1 Tax=Hoylesella saccharolytica TaxID=633701 RepID=UPI0028E6D26A|nr:leucine-rich repeat domain-containing protein [Hoylesella saccharolytica]